jgi:hypothetical protein
MAADVVVGVGSLNEGVERREEFKLGMLGQGFGDYDGRKKGVVDACL